MSGARAVQTEVLDEIDDENLRVYVVWTPVLQEDGRSRAVNAVQQVSDGRALHLWDSDKSLGLSLGTTVTLPRGRELAWDTYFVFDSQSEWGDTPPEPADWMHQLGNDDRTLDGSKLRSVVERLLKAVK